MSYLCAGQQADTEQLNGVVTCHFYREMAVNQAALPDWQSEPPYIGKLRS